LSYYRLRDLVRGGVINAKEEHINGSSIDVCLGDTLYYEDSRGGVVDLANKGAPALRKLVMGEQGYTMLPGQFLLAQTIEVFNLPSIISCEFKLKSSGARAGLDNALATWCDPHWNGSVLTLELRNNLQFHQIKLTPGMKIGQMIFFESDSVPVDRGYGVRGQYNGDKEAQPSKGMR
jgi:dCTP deaminase